MNNFVIDLQRFVKSKEEGGQVIQTFLFFFIFIYYLLFFSFIYFPNLQLLT